MKKLLLLGLACTFMFGVSGCMGEKVSLDLNGNSVFSEDFDSEINKKEEELITELITDVNSKYNETFKAYHFIPSKKGFNTDASSNYIFAENDEGLRLYLSKRNDSEETYIENYKNIKMAKILEDEFKQKMNFEGNMAILLSLKSLDIETKNVEEILDNTYNATILVQVPFEINDDNIHMIYEFYNEVYSYRDNHFQFLIAAGSNSQKGIDYMEQYM